MGNNNQSSDNVLAMPRCGPLARFTEECQRRTAALASRREGDAQSRPQRDVTAMTRGIGSALKNTG